MNYISKIAIKGGEEYPIRDSVSTDSFVDVVFYQDTTLTINGEERAFVRGKKYRIYSPEWPFKIGRETASYIDCTHLDVSSWTTLTGMFSYLKATTCKVDGLDTSNITNLSYFAMGCYFLQDLEVGGFDTRNVTDMKYALTDLTRIRALNVGGWDTSKVTSLQGCFAGCNAPFYNLIGWDLSNCRDISLMFYENTAANEILFGEGFGKCIANNPVLDLTYCADYKWGVDTLCNMYDRAANGMSTMTIKLHANTKAKLTETQLNTLATKGYTVL